MKTSRQSRSSAKAKSAKPDLAAPRTEVRLSKKSDSESIANGAGATLVESTMATLRKDILIGALPPDAKLGIHAMAERYQVGTTPLREALSRLTAIGLVVAIGQRGFRVAGLSRKDLEDLVHTRELVETAAVTAAMKHGDDAWEGDIIAALHRLKKFSASHGVDAFAKHPAEYDEVHKAFHAALVNACDSPRLLEMWNTLYEQSLRYRSAAMLRSARVGGLDDEHETIANLVLARQIRAASEAIKTHLQNLLVSYGGSV